MLSKRTWITCFACCRKLTEKPKMSKIDGKDKDVKSLRLWQRRQKFTSLAFLLQNPQIPSFEFTSLSKTSIFDVFDKDVNFWRLWQRRQFSTSLPFPSIFDNFQNMLSITFARYWPLLCSCRDGVCESLFHWPTRNQYQNECEASLLTAEFGTEPSPSLSLFPLRVIARLVISSTRPWPKTRGDHPTIVVVVLWLKEKGTARRNPSKRLQTGVILRIKNLLSWWTTEHLTSPSHWLTRSLIRLQRDILEDVAYDRSESTWKTLQRNIVSKKI